jgi:Kef-type K+ transport system membrane component KefB
MMSDTIPTTETFLIAMAIIFTVPYLIWRLFKTDYYAPLVIVQIITGILLGPGVLGKVFPDYYAFVFNPTVIQSLDGIAWWAVMIFVWIAGIELDLQKAWKHRGESGVTAGLALGTPFVFGCLAAAGMLMCNGWIGSNATDWQFILGVGMACAVTALPILILLMTKLDILREPIGQRILRYASLDDIAIWGVLALILMDWQRIEKQFTFLLIFPAACFAFRKLIVRLPSEDRWYAGLIWLAACSYGADWGGMHFMVGSFLAGVVMDTEWFDRKQIDALRQHVLLIIMPVFFLNSGLKTEWSLGGEAVFIAAGVLLIASVVGKLAAMQIAGKILKWEPNEAAIIGWLLQTKGLIMIIFANILLDKYIISNETFTALLLMSIASTMLTVPAVAPKLERMQEIIFKAK